MILTADLHLSDVASEEYRWRIFDHIRKLMQDTGERHVLILGDLTDFKDRFTGSFILRVIDALAELCIDGDARVDVIMGNHDKPLNGHPTWSVLNETHHLIFYHTKPTPIGKMLLLPYSDDPVTEWADLNFSAYGALFMHQMVTGAVSERGLRLENPGMVPLPNMPIYAGDIHTPQSVGPLTYVGAPHPVKFGDDYDCRLLTIDPHNFLITRVIELDPPRKHVLEVRLTSHGAASIKSPRYPLKRGDRVRYRVEIEPDAAEAWAPAEKLLRESCTARGLTIDKIEATVLPTYSDAHQDQQEDPNDPEDLLLAYGSREGIPEALMSVGLDLLRKTQSEGRS